MTNAPDEPRDEWIDGLPAPRLIARLEERRQANGVGELSLVTEPAMGGLLCAGVPGSWINMARCIGLEGPVDDAGLERLVDFYTSRGIEPACEVTMFADPTLIDGLGRMGFRVRSFEGCWAIAPGFAPAPVDLGPIEIRRVESDDADEVQRWGEVAHTGFAPPGQLPGSKEWAQRVREMCSIAEHPRAIAFGAYDGGAMIGAAAAAITAPGLPAPDDGLRVAGLFAASVLPGYRRRGIQRGLIDARLREAGRMGAVAACIESSPGIATERNARRAGFRLAYTKAVFVRPGEGLVSSR